MARAALRILDEEGLADLTMRRLAAALDVQASALYWHFPNKQSLLAELADRIVARAAGGVEPRPVSSIAREAAALRDALLAYRDGAEVVASTLALGLGDGAAHRRLVDAMSGEGVDPRTAARAAAVLLHFILGHVSHEQQRMQYDSVGVVAEGVPAVESSADEFEFGVGLLVAGVRSREYPPLVSG